MSGGEAPVFEPILLVIEAFAAKLGRNYRAVYGKGDPDHAPIIRATARLALERIAGTDAVYHDVLHTLFVTDVGQAILRGRAMGKSVSPGDWLHLTAATLLHDIGYLRGICPGDVTGHYVIDGRGQHRHGTARLDRRLPRTLACRARQDLRPPSLRRDPFPRRGADLPGDRATRFPVPEDGDHAETETERAWCGPPT